MKLPTIINKILTEYFRWLALGVAAIILIIGYLTVIAPKISEVQSTQITTRQADVERLQQQQTYLEDLKKSNSKFTQLFPAATRQTIDDFLPSDPDFPGLLLTVKNIITRMGLTLDSFAVAQGGQTAVAAAATAPTAAGTKTGATGAQAATTGGISVKTQDVTISVSGGTSYEAFKNLLTTIESSRRLFDVVSLSFSAATTDQARTEEAVASKSWNLVLRTYYLPASSK